MIVSAKFLHAGTIEELKSVAWLLTFPYDRLHHVTIDGGMANAGWLI